MQNTIFVGLDVHKATISVAIAGGERGGEFRHWGTINNRADPAVIGDRAAHRCTIALHERLTSASYLRSSIGRVRSGGCHGPAS